MKRPVAATLTIPAVLALVAFACAMLGGCSHAAVADKYETVGPQAPALDQKGETWDRSRHIEIRKGPAPIGAVPAVPAAVPTPSPCAAPRVLVAMPPAAPIVQTWITVESLADSADGRALSSRQPASAPAAPDSRPPTPDSRPLYEVRREGGRIYITRKERP